MSTVESPTAKSPLLKSVLSGTVAANENGDVAVVSPDNGDGESTIRVKQSHGVDQSRKIGVTGAVFLILNKMIGTGIFSTPSGIFASTGSVGICLVLWIVGGIISFCGLSVYLEFGLAIPRSGGEKNYLERVYRRPRYLATCIFAAQMVLLGFSAGNALAFGRYVLLASGSTEADGWTARIIGTAAITFATVTHAFLPKWGMRLVNVLGIFKLAVLAFIVFSGFAALTGHRLVPNPHNFDHAFRTHEGKGYGNGGAYGYATALLRIIYSYKGWENANYVVSELHHPRRTLAIAAPLAVAAVAVLYVLANVAYFAAVAPADLAAAEVLVAGLFFRNVFGVGAAARCLPGFVAVSNLGNVLAVSFGHSRVNQELAREGVLPASQFWASGWPYNAPSAALLLHWIVTVTVLIGVPVGPAYNFIVDLYTYPGAWINAFVAAGLLYLRFRPSENWTSPWRSPLVVTAVFGLANIFLAIVPLIPPNGGEDRPNDFPFFVFPLVGVGVLLVGVAYWVVWAKLTPWAWGTALRRKGRGSWMMGTAWRQ